MRSLVLAVFAFCLLATFIPALAQENSATRIDPYNVCVTAMEKTPQEAVVPCKRYLAQNPHDSPDRIECVTKWVANYEKVLPYAKFLQSLPGDPKAAWFVFEPDQKIELPETDENDAPFKMQIARKYSGSYEEEMLRKAEAVYPRASRSAADVFRSSEDWVDHIPKPMTPIWGGTGNDNIQEAEVVTASAVRYYYDLTNTARENPKLATGFTARHTTLKYDASIKYFGNYSHNTEKFDDVYLADLTLVWGFNCGGLCGVGFTLNKIVVLDRSGNVIAMFSELKDSWVS